MPHIEVRKVLLHELLRDRAAAAEISPAAEDVGQDGARRADEIDAGVIVEPAILDRDHRLRPCAAGSPRAARRAASRVLR